MVLMNLTIELDGTSGLHTKNELQLAYKQGLKACWEQYGQSMNPPLIYESKQVENCKIQWRKEWFTTLIESKQYDMLSMVDDLCGKWNDDLKAHATTPPTGQVVNQTTITQLIMDSLCKNVEV